MKVQDIPTLQVKLPKHPGILEQEQYFNSAVLIPFLIRDGECELLFQKRANHIRQGGEICFPGGAFDPRYDNNHQETAIRETIEELGIARERISLLGSLDTLVAPHGLIIKPFVGILHLHDLDELSIDANEVERVFTVPVAYFEHTQPEQYRIRVQMQSSYIDQDGKETILLPVKELGLPERYAASWGKCDYRVLVYHTLEDIIWGITAKLIYALVQKLQV